MAGRRAPAVGVRVFGQVAVDDRHVELGDVLDDLLHLLVVANPRFDLLEHTGGHINGMGFALNGRGELVGEVLSALGGHQRSSQDGTEAGQFFHGGIPANGEPG